MAFSTQDSDEVLSEINVTPLVDVMLVLLVVFIVTAPLLTNAISINLPKTESVAPPEQKDPLVVSIDGAGKWFINKDEIQPELLQGNLTALPLPNAWADLTICGLVLGHVENLEHALAELRRVTRPGGVLLCSDVHPIGHALGWLRDFNAGGRRYAVRHTPHLYSHWHATCAALGLDIEQVVEPMLDPADIAAGARFDPVALQVPVAIVYQLRRQP